MLTLLAVIGVLAIIFGIAMLFIYPSLNKEDVRWSSDSNDPSYRPGYERRLKERKSSDFLLLFNKGKSISIIGVGFILFILNGMFFYNPAGTATSIQYIWGGDQAVYTQGIKLKLWGRTIPMSYEIPIQDVNLKVDQELPNEEGIHFRKAAQWEFADAIKANVGTAVIISIDTKDDSVFLNMADRNKTEDKLVYSRIMPNIDAALKNTCKLMDAQDYISGEASTFDRFFKDQLQNGMYQVQEYYEKEEVPEVIGDTGTVRTVSKHKRSNKQKKYKIKKDRQGNIIRDESNSLKQYGLTIIQAQVTSIDWEKSFDIRLDKQKDEVAKTQLEKQEAERQFYTAQKEIAKGEAEKASERAKLEKEQIKLTIAAETKAKVAVQNVIVEQSQLKVEKLKKLSAKERADAKYYTNQRLVSAGLTPQEKLEGQIKMNKDKWDAVGGITFPASYVDASGSNGKSNGLMNTLIGADIAKGMMRK